MGIKQAIEVINSMEADGVVNRYAIGGAIAAFNYIQPSTTQDLDILVSFDTSERKSGLVTLTPIINYLATKGYKEFRNEGIVVEGWPVQFIPVASSLDEDALKHAQDVKIDFPEKGEVKARILSPEHVIATALNLGRPKDFGRIADFVKDKAFDPETLGKVLERHNLSTKWRSFCVGLGIPNPVRQSNRGRSI